MNELNNEVEVDLFGEPIVKPKPVKLPPAKPQVAKEDKGNKATASVSAAPKKTEIKTFGTDYQYAYAGHIANLPQDGMTLEVLREYLQVDFPELSAKRTVMDVDTETKIIVPIVKGAKSG